MLMNIVLNELDAFVEDRLMPEYTTGKKRRLNKAYTNLKRKAQREKQKGNWKHANDIRRQYTKMPSVAPKDPTYRRLGDVRYADDFLLGYIGTKREAERIKERLGQFLKEELELELSEEKTLITNAFTEKARFLNYEISRNKADNIMKEVKGHTRRTANAILWFSIPRDVTIRWESKVTEGGKVIHRKDLMNLSDYDIIMSVEIELQGLINYYSMAHNLRTQMGKLRYLWQESLLKTLAVTHKMSKPAADKRYRKFLTIDGRRRVGVEMQREAKKPLRATFGKKPLTWKAHIVSQERQQTIYRNSNELSQGC